MPRRMSRRAGLLVLLLAFAFGPVGARSASPASFTLEGTLRHPGTISVADLRSLPPTTLAVSLATDHGTLSGTWTGVLVWTLLQRAGVRTDSKAKNAALLHTLIVSGSDGYAVALSFAEIDPRFGGSAAIIAYSHDGQPLPPEEGLRLIVPSDKFAARAVRDVVRVEVR